MKSGWWVDFTWPCHGKPPPSNPTKTFTEKELHNRGAESLMPFLIYLASMFQRYDFDARSLEKEIWTNTLSGVSPFFTSFKMSSAYAIMLYYNVCQRDL